MLERTRSQKNVKRMRVSLAGDEAGLDGLRWEKKFVLEEKMIQSELWEEIKRCKGGCQSRYRSRSQAEFEVL